MAVKKISDKEIKAYYGMLAELGEDKFYARLVGQGISRFANKIENPDLELLDLSEAFFAANRRDEDEIIFLIGKITRRAAHFLNRKLEKVRKTSKNSNRFLSVVR